MLGFGDRIGRHHAGRVGARPAQHVCDVFHRVVVTQDRGDLVAVVHDVGDPGAEVAPGRVGRVEDVVGVGFPVTVAVRAPGRPGARDELHGAHRPVVAGVAVDASAVGVADDGVAGERTVENGSRDGIDRGAVLIHRTVARVVRLDAPDPGQQEPRQFALRGFGPDAVRGELVGLQDDAGDAERPGGQIGGDAELWSDRGDRLRRRRGEPERCGRRRRDDLGDDHRGIVGHRGRRCDSAVGARGGGGQHQGPHHRAAGGDAQDAPRIPVRPARSPGTPEQAAATRQRTHRVRHPTVIEPGTTPHASVARGHTRSLTFAPLLSRITHLPPTAR